MQSNDQLTSDLAPTTQSYDLSSIHFVHFQGSVGKKNNKKKPQDYDSKQKQGIKTVCNLIHNTGVYLRIDGFCPKCCPSLGMDHFQSREVETKGLLLPSFRKQRIQYIDLISSACCNIKYI